MSFLSKIFNYVPKEEREGLSLAGNSCWEISCMNDFSTFLKSLIQLIPADSILYLEGVNTPKKLRSFLNERAAQNICKVEIGTIWPRPEMFHMQASPENLVALANIVKNYSTPQAAVHLHVYKEGKILLQWYDAFAEPLFVSKEISEDRIKAFCDTLTLDYKESHCF